ncbi:trypsin-like peptidase domain-containing protein [Luteolibacter luteus]|uniref:Trypsin-like peptidase domain-containing protein n=1 Tax=Luteolibacter luteus TaxID=2728835 RepID=A0A858RGR5_9BACT|nr:trypsin-like peptidase domain-containing protein [Luteolibacter luteus]QJE95313.1 trypsin-like peptidase domain-containing protein [Luteolibacter luteus]
MKNLLLSLFLSISALFPARAADFATTMMEATFKFFDPDSTSTCFLVKRAEPDAAFYLVTTAHTVERTKGENAILVLREPKPDGSYERHDHTIKIRDKDQPLWVRHAKEDVAVLRLGDALPVAVPAISVTDFAKEEDLATAGVHICSPLFVLTYPQRFEANGAGFPVARQGIFASPPLLPVKTHPTFLADFTTFAGDSGGPVFIEGKGTRPLVAGIVLAQHHHEDKIHSEYEERVIRHPLGMGTVLHAGYVLETLEQAATAAQKK